jgi:hypothetical protein
MKRNISGRLHGFLKKSTIAISIRVGGGSFWPIPENIGIKVGRTYFIMPIIRRKLNTRTIAG